MNITLNGKKISVAEQTNIEQLIKTQQISTNGIAIAVNEEIIARQLWSKTILQPNQKIIIITATQGG